MRQRYDSWKKKMDAANSNIARVKVAAGRAKKGGGKKNAKDKDDDSDDDEEEEGEDEKEDDCPAQGSRKGDLCNTCKPHATGR